MLRKRWIIFPLLMFLLYGSATLWADVITDVKKKAVREEKPVVAYFYSKYCTACKAMEKEVLADKEIKKILKESVVFIAIDVEKNRESARVNKIWAYPTTVFFEKTGSKIGTRLGYIEKEEFKKILILLKQKNSEK